MSGVHPILLVPPPVEREHHPVAQFLLNLKKINIYIATQAVLDALDIWLSAIKYVFDALNPSSGNKSTAQMYQWLSHLDGLLVLILGSVFFALFAFCGNYFDTKKGGHQHVLMQQFSKLAEAYWPFLRDCFKGLKWTFKGTRSFLLVFQLILDQSLVALITPLGIGLGLVSAATRAWNRGMVERRKLLQGENDAFREHIKFINAGLVDVGEEWVNDFERLSPELKSLYAGTVIRQQHTDNYYCVKDGKLVAIEGLTSREQAFLSGVVHDPSILKTDYYHYKQKLSAAGLGQGQLAQMLATKSRFLDQVTDHQHQDFHKLYAYPKFQADANKAYSSALANGLLNSPYYFLGVLSLVLNLIPAGFFPFAVAFCSVFMVLNVVAELYQEYDYQRRLSISQSKAQLAMIKRLVSLEWDKINDVLDGVLQGQAITAEMKKTTLLQLLDAPSIEYMQDGTLPASPLVIDVRQQDQIKASMERLSRYYQDFTQCKQKLKAAMVLENRATFMQGIKNGLHMYGVFNGCLMTVATIAFLSGWTFGLPFFYASLAAGFLFTVAGVLFTVLLVNRKKPGSENSSPATVERTQGEIEFWVPEKLPELMLNEHDISPSKNLMISEQCEVLRQFMSGSKKGVKFLQTVLMLSIGMSEDVPIPLKITYGMVALAYGGIFTMKGLRGLMRVDNHDYEQSWLVGRFFNKKQTALVKSKSGFFNTAMEPPALGSARQLRAGV